MNKPRQNSINFIEDRLLSHSKVESIEKIQDYYYLIKRNSGLRDIRLVLSDDYTVGIADLIQIKETYPDMNAILTVSSWNGYTKSVKIEAKKENIGVFVPRELLGALNLDQYWKYIKMDDDGEPIDFGGRSG
ncbi:hypothetical protein [Rossellomorea aquimaris]|uniref:Restriction endonuclease type IV Mrr domain-containing protein n=1 Tax=Rossellomorea aquimaris TaxID=189382 RepID=A0A1J6W0A0_9BACI|nr:hypothetical protein [Rossellomorea aquimaris]OIU71021.1 hypothetical protein BHE18_08205 [Rossellomorea aquimaris]